MNIIIVGPDGTGKSTLASDLSKILMMPVFHGHGNDDNKISRWIEMKEWDHTIFDRAYFIDDQVYSPVVGVTPAGWEPTAGSPFIEDSLLIYWDNEMAEDNIKELGDDYITYDMLGSIRTGYMNFFAETGIAPDLIFQNAGYANYDSNMGTIIRKYAQKNKSRDL